MSDNKSDGAHRVLILDNDETTGSYYILFSLYDLLALSHFGSRLDPKKTLESLAKSCEEFGVFRPGLRSFLEQIARMKRDGEIEKLCLYTNQLDVRDVYHYPHWRTKDGTIWSVPLMISKMFSLLVGDDGFVDELYTRPLGNVPQINNYPVKDLSRVFTNLYPKEPVNLGRTMFVDDLHHKKYIIDSSKSGTDKESRCNIPVYSRQLPKSAFGTIIDRILGIHGIELHWHNSILRDSIESGWLHLNSNIKNLHTSHAVLKRIRQRIQYFFDYERKEKLGGLNKKRIRDGTSTKRRGTTKGKKYHSGSKRRQKTKGAKGTKDSKGKVRTRKRRDSSA